MAGILDKLKTKLQGARVDAEVKPPMAATAPGGRLASPPEQRRTHRVYVGLDFGTCSCKAVVQIDPEDTKRRRFLAVAHPTADADTTDGTSPLLCPSAVDVRDGQFFFGYQAEAAACGQAVRSFKMCLPCLWNDQRTNGPCPRCKVDKPGHFLWGGRWWSAEEVSILFLSHVIRGVKDSVLNYLAGEPARFFINSAAPLDQMPQDSELGRSFQRVLYYANRLSDRVSNPWPVVDAAVALDEIRQQGMPNLNDCPTTVFPETHAAMTSVLAPLPVNQNFGTIDIGAGTTDVALFYFHRTQGEPEACYYSAKSEFVGIDQIDEKLRPLVPAGANVRAWRQALTEEELEGMVERFAAPVAAMWKYFRQRLGESYKCNPGPEYWSDLTLFLIGGGAQLPAVVRRFEQPFPWIVGDRTINIEVPSIPASLLVLKPDGGTASLAGRDGASLLLLAYGLSHGAATIAKWVRDYSFYRVHQTGNGGLVAEVPYSEI